MRPYIQLYIDDKLVEFKEPPQVFFTYAHNDLHNPTVVKNSFSKTLTIDGTPKNNQIFGCFGDMTRIVDYKDGNYTGAYFNPSRKVEFILLRNSEMMERGYVKLDKVVKKGNELKYEITLYGGLGQFLYNLSYGEDGEQLKLSSLKYDYNLDMEINALTVTYAWQHINGYMDRGDIYDFINFVPCYNGIPQDFSADKVALDVESFKEGEINGTDLSNLFTTDKDGYSSVNGWILGELPKEYDEWQTKDLRSYLQRPVIRFKEIFKACCKPENNGGYKVDLNDDFFSENNPYWEDSWMTLPLLTDNENVDYEAPNISMTNTDGKITISGLESGKNYTLKYNANLGANVNSNESSLYTTSIKWVDDGNSDSSAYEVEMNVARYVQMIAYDNNGNIVGGSNINVLYSEGIGGFELTPEYDAGVSYKVGRYERKADGTYMFSEGVDFTMTVEYEDGMYFKIVEKFATVGMYGNVPEINQLHTSMGVPYNVSSWFADVADNVEVSYKKGMGWVISKKTFLNSEHSPADYFLNYLKMFNLHIWSDNVDKTIYIRQRKNYFNGNIINMDNYVDRDSDITITPLTFGEKWWIFNNEIDGNSHLNKTYKDNYGVDYGIQKINTNYNFDSSSKNLIEKSVLKGCICSRGKSKYYTNVFLRVTEDEQLPPYFLDGFKTYLFKEDDTVEGDEITPKTNERSANWYKDKGYDFLPKPDFRDKDGKGIDGANVLLFYSGGIKPVDVNGEDLRFNITDDIPEFETLNDGEPCWIWSYNSSLSHSVDKLPLFSRYKINSNNWVTHSFDFGTPKQIYVDYSIDEGSSIYHQYWKQYLTDELNVNTRVVECKMLFKERVNPDYLMNFIYYDGCYWKIQEIVDYDITSSNTTKVKMIKVNDLNNYMS